MNDLVKNMESSLIPFCRHHVGFRYFRLHDAIRGLLTGLCVILIEEWYVRQAFKPPHLLSFEWTTAYFVAYCFAAGFMLACGQVRLWRTDWVHPYAPGWCIYAFALGRNHPVLLLVLEFVTVMALAFYCYAFDIALMTWLALAGVSMAARSIADIQKQRENEGDFAGAVLDAEYTTETFDRRRSPRRREPSPNKRPRLGPHRRWNY